MNKPTRKQLLELLKFEIDAFPLMEDKALEISARLAKSALPRGNLDPVTILEICDEMAQAGLKDLRRRKRI